MTSIAPAPAPTTDAGTGRSSATVLLQLLAVVAATALLGGATSFLQTVLPDALRPFANSASGWTLLTAIAIAACRARTAPSAVMGAAGFVALVLGYQVVSTLRGFPTSEELFLTVAVLVGPFIGVAAAWLRRDGVRAALGCGVLAGVAIGDAAYGLLVVLATTGWVYWVLIGAVGLALLAVTVARRPRDPRTALLAVGSAAVIATAFVLAYTTLGSIGA